MNFNKNPNRSFDKPSRRRERKRNARFKPSSLFLKRRTCRLDRGLSSGLLPSPTQGKKKDRSSVLDLIVGISSRRENRRRKGGVCVSVSTHPRCMEHATTIQFEALRPEACDNITATRYVLGVCTPSPPLFLSVFPSARARMEEDG